MMGSKQDKRNFYRDTQFVLPPLSKFRQFRLKFEPNFWSTVPFSVNSSDKLRDYCVDTLPDAVYFMTSRFNNAKNVKTKVVKNARHGAKRQPFDPIACNVFHGSELYFDFDVEDYGDSMKYLFLEVMKLYSKLAEKYEKIKFVFSGRGFHIWVLDFEDKFFSEEQRANIFFWKPRVKERFYLLQKTKVAHSLLEGGHIFDGQITWDTRRILRVPGSYNEKSFQKVTYFDALPIDFLRKFETHTFSASIANDLERESFPSEVAQGMIRASQKQRSPGYREILRVASPEHAGPRYGGITYPLASGVAWKSSEIAWQTGDRNGNT